MVDRWTVTVRSIRVFAPRIISLTIVSDDVHIRLLTFIQVKSASLWTALLNRECVSVGFGALNPSAKSRRRLRPRPWLTVIRYLGYDYGNQVSALRNPWALGIGRKNLPRALGAFT